MKKQLQKKHQKNKVKDVRNKESRMSHKKYISLLILTFFISGLKGMEQHVTEAMLNELKNDDYQRNNALHFLPYGSKTYNKCTKKDDFYYCPFYYCSNDIACNGHKKENHDNSKYDDSCTILAAYLLAVNRATLINKKLPAIDSEIETITQEINDHQKDLNSPTTNVFKKAHAKNLCPQKQTQLKHLQARKAELEEYKKQDPDGIFQNFPHIDAPADIKMFESALYHLTSELKCNIVEQEIKIIESAFDNARTYRKKSEYSHQNRRFPFNQ